jgi:hypothetical protein
MMRRGIIASSGAGPTCLFALEGVNSPAFRPLTVDSRRQEVGAVYPMVDPQYPVWFAATPDAYLYSTAEDGWDGWRIVQMVINRVDSGVVRFGIRNIDYTSSIDVVYDGASGDWAGLVDGVEQNSSASSWTSIVTFKVHGATGDAVAMVGDEVVASQGGMFNGVPFGGLISWDGENSISGDEFAGAIYSSASAINPETLDSGSSDWCGNEIPIAKPENVADDVSIVGSLDYLEIEDVVQVDTTLPENTTPNVGITGALEYLEIETVEEPA